VGLWLSIERTNARATGKAVDLTPGKERILRGAGRIAIGGLAAVALATLELDYPQALVAAMVAPDHRAIAATITVAAVGFFLLLFGGLRLVLRQGQPMSHVEIEADLPRTRLGLARGGGMATYRQFGPAEGAKAEAEISITEMKKAFLSGAWRRDPWWQTVFIMTAGGLMMTYGGFGAAIAAGPLLAKVLCGGVLGYSTFQLVAAVWRA
jgi:hypothetical protein